MIFYCIAVVTVLLAKVVPEKLKIVIGRKKYEIAWLICMLPPFFVSALRYNVGRDYYTYTVQYFNKVGLGSRKLEPLFSLLIDLCHAVLKDPQSLIILMAVFFCAIVFRCIYMDSNNILLSVILFFVTGTYYFSLSMMRQMVTFALFLFSLRFFINRKYVVVTISLIMGTLIHSTGYIYILFYFVMLLIKYYYKSLDANKLRLISLIMLMVGFVFSNVVREQIIKLLDIFGSYYSKYFNSIHDYKNGSITYLALGCIPYAIALSSKRPKNTIDIYELNKYDTYFWATWMGALLSILLPIIPNGERMVFMFMPVSILSIPYFYDCINFRIYKNLKFYYILFCIITITLISIRFFLVEDSLYLLPYQWIWQKN